jgi:adenosylcobinamide-GDP ribazoletransferase
LFALPLVLAWARLGTLAWSRWLRPLKEGRGERFAWQLPAGWIFFWTASLLVVSALIAPALCLAPLVIAAWGAWLRVRLGGMTGDCLGAGVEVTEAALLLIVVLTSGAMPRLL